MRVIALIALREYLENIKTKGFWLGVLLFPVIFIAIFFFSNKLATSAPARHYLLIDQSGQYAEAVESAIRREHQRRVLQEFVSYLQENRKDLDLEHTLAAETSSPVDQLIDDVSNDELAALDMWLDSGGLNVALSMISGSLREDAPAFVEPGQQFIAAPLPAGVDVDADPELIIEQLRPYLTGGRTLTINSQSASLFALILIPAGVTEDIVRPGTMPGQSGTAGIQYWASNLTDSRLSSAIQNSVNNSIRLNEYSAQGIDIQAVRDIQSTRMPVSRLDPKKDAGEETVSAADTFRQWAPVGFVYLMFISLIQSLQYLLSNTIEEKANRIIEVLLASVTPGELMMGKLLGIGMSGITTIATWIISFLLFISFYQSSETQLIGQIITVLFSSELIPWFVFYYISGYALYSGIFLAIGSLCNTLKEAQSLMTPMMMILVVPLVTMSFIAQDPNGSVARIMSWIPLFTPFAMMNRAAAQPPMIDIVGTTLLLLASVALVLWLSGKIFRQGVLRTGQPPRVLELLRMLRT
jgi:ABC-2 type transport system permease protein